MWRTRSTSSPAQAAPAPAPPDLDDTSSLAAALQALGLSTDAGPMPGVAHDSSSGHENDPWRSIVRARQNDDFALPVKRFAMVV